MLCYDMNFLTESRITERHSNLRIDRYLASRFGYLSRAEWQREISRGKIFYNGSVLTRYDKKIRTGDRISYSGRDAAEPNVDTNYSIIYEDECFIGINKPANLPVHPAGVFYHNTLITLMQKSLGVRLFPLHRLDRETSGIIVIAKDVRVARYFQERFSSIEKTYLAIVHGVPREKTFTVDIPIEADPSSELEHKQAAFRGAGKEAHTKFITIHSNNRFSFVEAIPITGRQHQIRVHLKCAGHPILGDRMYGIDDRPDPVFVRRGPGAESAARLGFWRSALHARSILFHHPVANVPVSISAPIPEDMRSFMRQEMAFHG